jgi:hypothetical protein
VNKKAAQEPIHIPVNYMLARNAHGKTPPTLMVCDACREAFWRTLGYAGWQFHYVDAQRHKLRMATYAEKDRARALIEEYRQRYNIEPYWED